VDREWAIIACKCIQMLTKIILTLNVAGQRRSSQTLRWGQLWRWSKRKGSRRNHPFQRKGSSLSKTLHPQLPRTRMRNVLCVGKHSTHPCLGKCGCSVSFASSGHMRHALRVQNILSVTTVTMSRQMPFVMFLFVCTVYLLTPVNISQVSIQMDLFLLPDSSGSHSVVSNFSTVFSTYMPLFFKGSV